MKKALATFCTLLFCLGFKGMASAIPVTFDIDGNNSSVELSNVSTWGWTSLSVELADNLESFDQFILEDGQTQAIDFLTFTAAGTGLGSFDIAASLAFELPMVAPVEGAGSGAWGIIDLGWWGSFSAGALYWSAMPQFIYDGLGNKIEVAFEEGFILQCGNTTTLQAYITNHGGGTTPVPEPATMLLFGTGLAGLVATGRKRARKS